MRGRLVLVSLAVSAMVAIAFLVPLALLVRSVARDRALTAADRDATALSPVLALTTAPSDVELAIARTRSGAAGRVTVHLPDGTAVGAEHLPDADVERARAEKISFHHDDEGRTDLYQAVVLPSGTAVIEVSVPDGELTQGVLRSWAALGSVAVVLVAGSVAVADRLARSVVRPTRRLAGAAAELGAGNLDVRVVPDGPTEIAEMGSAFNDLAERVRQLLAKERELVADLSHRLRTPLTALRLDTEALGEGEAATRVRADADRLERTVTEIIEVARRHAGDKTAARCQPTALVAERAAFWAALAEDQERPWEVDLAARSPDVALAAEDLEAALDALLGNVFRHTPEGSAVAVKLASRAPGHDATSPAERPAARPGARLAKEPSRSRSTGRETVVITVEDGGPGMADAVVGRGLSSAGSTGLGLDIARRTAEAAGGHLVVAASRLGGARVELHLPALEPGATPPRT